MLLFGSMGPHVLNQSSTIITNSPSSTVIGLLQEKGQRGTLPEPDVCTAGRLKTAITQYTRVTASQAD